MQGRLQDKVALVTASTAGIGLGIVRRLLHEGAHVIISSRKQLNVDQTIEHLCKEGFNKVSGIACHVGDINQINKLVSFALQRHDHIDILISNAAVNPEAGPILSMNSGAIDKIIDINIKAAIYLTQAVVPHMPKHASSSIVFITSYTAYNPSPPISMYAISKTALLGLTKALAEELGPDGIRVNAIAPGIVPTKFAAALVASPELEELNKSKTLLGRLGRAEDMAATVAFLASDDASYITAETIVVAGGMQSRL